MGKNAAKGLVSGRLAIRSTCRPHKSGAMGLREHHFRIWWELCGGTRRPAPHRVARALHTVSTGAHDRGRCETVDQSEPGSRPTNRVAANNEVRAYET